MEVNTSLISHITFVRSYADFGTWMANEWLQRGVSLYWDNTYLYPSYNTRTTAPYRTEDGHIQPAPMIWNARDYHHPRDRRHLSPDVPAAWCELSCGHRPRPSA